MDYSTSSLLNISPSFYHGKSVDELGERWLCTSLELESLKMQAQDEIRRRDEQLIHVKELLYKAMIERNEALKKCQSLQQQVNVVKMISTHVVVDPLSTSVSTIDDELELPIIHNNINNNNNLTLFDCDDHSIVSSSSNDQTSSSKLQSFNEEVMQRLVQIPHKSSNKLPEKGKLLEAVMNAGPLLQTLLVAGALPQWKHPPPQLESIDEIPPVTISRKRSLLTHHHHHHHKLQKQHNNNNNNNTLLHQ